MDKCIYREYLGGSEMVDFNEFADYVIQDEEVALEIGYQLLRLGAGEDYIFNENEPRFIERYSVTNHQALTAQMREFITDNSCPICGYKLEDYAPGEIVCGACLDNYTEQAAALGDATAILMLQEKRN